MELRRAISSRRMTRSFLPDALEDEVLARVLSPARFAPSAGNTPGVELLVLTSAERRDRFWELASEGAWRAGGEGAAIAAAPAIVLPVADPAAYVARYGAPDKEKSLLAGRPASQWPVPYWLVDASFATMVVLLSAADAGLGALFFQLHAPADAVLSGLGVPPGRVTIGAVALGHPDPGASSRPSMPSEEGRQTLHFEHW